MGKYNRELNVLVRFDSNTSGLTDAEKALKGFADAVIYTRGKGSNASKNALNFNDIINKGLAKALNVKDFTEKKLADVQSFLANNTQKTLKSVLESAQKKHAKTQKAEAALFRNFERQEKLIGKAAKGPLKTTDRKNLDSAIRMSDKYVAAYEKRVGDFEEASAKYADLQQRHNEAEKIAFRLRNGGTTPEIKKEMAAARREQIERRDKLARTFFSENVYPYLAKWGHASNFKNEQEMLAGVQRAMSPLISNFEEVPGGRKAAKDKFIKDFSSLAGLSNVAKRFDSFMGDYGRYTSALEELKGNFRAVLESFKDPVGAMRQMGVLNNKANTLWTKFNVGALIPLREGIDKELKFIPRGAGKHVKAALYDIMLHSPTLKNEIEDFGRVRDIFGKQLFNRGKKPEAPASEWGRTADAMFASNISQWNQALRQNRKVNENYGKTLPKTHEYNSSDNLPWTSMFPWAQEKSARMQDDLLRKEFALRHPDLFRKQNPLGDLTQGGLFPGLLGGQKPIGDLTQGGLFSNFPGKQKPLGDLTQGGLFPGLLGGMKRPSKNHIIIPPEFGGGTGGNRPQSGLAHALWGGEPVNLREIIRGIRNPTDENGEAIKNIENSTFWYAMSDATRQIGHVAWRNTLHSAQVSMDEFLQFEGAMTDILKHFAGLRNEKTNLPNEKYYAMREKIIAMSKDLPLSQTDIALAAGRAARMGIDEPDLLRNVELATKLGVGFNMSPDAVMESIAKIAASSGISPSDNKALMKIGDAINYLDDHTNATGEDIFEFLKDSTAGGKTIGLSVGETAAIGTALMSLGTNPSTAKTAFKNLMLIATSGPRNQKKGERYLSYAGIENEEMMKRMRANPRQGLLWLLEKLSGAKNNEVGKDTASIIRFVTGQQSALPTMKLTSREGINTLKRLFDMLDNASGGWTEKEYETKMKADPNREMALLENALKELRIEFGKNLFPAVKEFAPVIKDVMRGVGGFMANNPKLVQGMVGGGLAIGASANAMATISDAMIIFDAIRRAGGFKNLKSLGGMFTALSPLLAIQTNQVLPTIGAELTNLWGALKGGGQGLWGVLGGAWKTMTTVPVGNVSAVGTAAGVGGAAVLGTMIGSQIWKYIDENYIIPKQQAEAKAEAESGAARKGRVNNIALERAHRKKLEDERAKLWFQIALYERSERKRQLAALPGDYDYPRFSPGRERAEAARQRLDKVDQEIAFSSQRIRGARARAQVLPSKFAPEGTSKETRERWGTLNQAGIDWTEQRQYWEQRKSFYDASFANNPSLRDNEATMSNYGDIQNKLREIKAFQQEIQNQSDALVVKAMEEQKKYFADFRMMNESWAKADKDRWDNATVRATASLQEWVLHSQDAGGKMKNSFDPVLDTVNAKLGNAKTLLTDIKTLAESMKNLNINININGQAPAGKGGAAIPIGGGKTGGKGGGPVAMSLPGSMGMSFLLDSPAADNRTYNSTANITINNNSPSSQIAVNQWARQLGGILGGANREAAVYA